MTTSPTNLVELSQVAFASYANLAQGLTVLSQNISALKQTGFAEKQAAEFATLYPAVVLPTYHDSPSDLDVTVFKDAAGNLALGIRGTLPGHDLMSTDVQIGLEGAAYDQIVALYNWWRRVSTASGQVTQFAFTSYTTSSPTPPTSEAPEAIYLYADTPIPGPNGEAFTTYYYLEPSAPVAATGELVPLLAADPDHKIDVTGHSLGAHLALAFSSLFGTSVGQAVGFDTPGFIDSATNRQFFAALSAAVPTNTNSGGFVSVIADEASIGSMPFNAIAGVHSRPGIPIDIAIENQWQSDEPFPEGVFNHSMKMLTDSLVVFNLLSILDPTLTPARYKDLLGSAAQGTAAGYERLVDGVESVLNIDQTLLLTGNNQREALYHALYGVQSANVFQAIAGKVRIDPSGKDLGAEARNDFSALASLITLSPVVLTATSATNQTALDGVLSSAWGQTYLDWQVDKAMSQAGRDAGELTFTDEWIRDRSLLIAAVGLQKQRDDTTGQVYDASVPANRRYEFQYYGGLPHPGETLPPLQMLTYARTAQTLSPQFIAFGDSAGNQIDGMDNQIGDCLYGGAGNDIVNGGAGADRLEGNADDDSLLGGAGNDTLLGGTGDDFLEGGADDDLLLGGQGNDTYFFTAGWGHDLIEDSGGQGELRVPGYDGGLPVGNKVPGVAGVYRSPDGAVTYTRSSDGKTLTIGFDGRTESIAVRNWQPGQLGITLDDSAPPPEQYGSVYADVLGVDEPNLNVLDQPRGDGQPAPVRSSSQLETSVEILAGGGADNVSTVTHTMYFFVPTAQMLAQVTPDFHREYVEGGDGNDTIYTGDGRDTVLGGAGDDIIYAGLYVPVSYEEGFNSDAPYPNYDSYFLPDGTEVVTTFQFNMGMGESDVEAIVLRDFYAARRQYDSNIIDAGDGADVVYSGWGDDVAHGGSGDDALFGQAGDDALFGDDGNDSLYGDSLSAHILQEYVLSDGRPFRLVSLIYTPAQLHGQDTLDGGTGDDWLYGMGGDDTLLGGTGNDSLFGDTDYTSPLPLDPEFLVKPDFLPSQFHGNDYLDGGDGADQLVGGAFDDRLFGGGGNDRMWGDTDKPGLALELHGDDTLDGGDGDDSLIGGGSSDEIYGGSGNDSIFGDDAVSIVAASAHGDDTIDAGDGNDTVFGGGGNDFILGGAGDDRIAGDGGAGSALTGDDWIDGGDGDDLIYGEGSNDWIQGGAGADTLRGDDGADTLEGGAGNDDLKGGNGNDTYRFGLGDGRDTVDNAAIDGAFSTDTLQLGVSSGAVAFSRFGDDLFARLNDSDLLQLQGQFSGNGVDQVLFSDGTTWTQADVEAHLVAGIGTSGNDLLGGTAGDDVISAGDGDDLIRGDAGADQLIGGAGSDTYYFEIGFGADLVDERATDSADANWIVLGPGLHTGNVQVSNGLTYNQQYDLQITVFGPGGLPTGDSIVVQGFFDQPNANSSIDGICFADGTEWTAEWIHQHFYAEPGSRPGNAFSGKYTDDTLVGLVDDESIVGLAGNDSILGGEGNDYLHGDNGHDTVVGGVGDDHVFGDAGNDLLRGGTGNDALNGGSGDDVYLFGRGDGQDLVDEAVATPGGSDAIRFDAGILPTDIEVMHSLIAGVLYPDRLSLRIAGTTDEISTAGWWSGSNLISRVEFADGTVWTTADIRVRLWTTGTAASETLLGTYAADSIRGGAGYDFLGGGGGADTYLFGAGDGGDQIYLEVPDGGPNVIRFDAGVAPNDVLVSRSGQVVTLQYTADDYVSIWDWGPSSPDVIQRVEFADGTVWQASDLLSRTGLGTVRGDYLFGSSIDDWLRGQDGADQLTGNAGNDTLDGGTGDDWLQGSAGNDTYVYRAGDGSDRIDNNDPGAASVDTLRLDASIAPAMLRVRRTLTDLLIDVPGSGDQIRFPNWFVDESQQIDRVEFSDGTNWNAADLLAQIGGPTDDDDWLVGTTSADSIAGLSGNDLLYGLDGNDTLSGGEGSDILFGGEGADQLVGDAGNDALIGESGSDTLTGGAGDDAISGGAGVDTLMFVPGFGSDVVDDMVEADGSLNTIRLKGVAASQVVVSRTDQDLYLLIDGSTDRIAVTEWFSWAPARAFQVQFDDGTLWDPTALETRLDGAHAGAGDDVLYGAPSNDVVSGVGGNDILSGGEGNDILRGGAGDDSLFGSLGNALLDGGSGDDYLSAGATGVDFFVGGEGDDTVSLWTSVNQVFAFNLGDGNDTLDLLDATSEVNVISIGGGATLGDIWFGRAPGGEDLLIGVGANDSIRLPYYLTYEPTLKLQVVSAPSIQTIDLSAAIADFLAVPDTDPSLSHWPAQSALTAHLVGTSSSQAVGGRLAYQYGVSGSTSSVPDFEAQWLVSRGSFGTAPQSISSTGIAGTSGNDSLTGTGGADLLQGFGGNDTLNGGAGADWLAGGPGNDLLVVDNVGDLLFELPGEGTDMVQTSISWTLGPNLESLTLTGTGAVNGTGNALDNVLAGNTAANVLTGGDGSDTYVVGAGDTVVEAVGQGTDTIQSSVTWTLGNNIENLTLTGSSAITGTGNALDNVLTGNSGANVLAGGAGNDTYVVGTGDTVNENANEGIDTVQSSVTWTLGNNIENLTLMGGSAINGTGNALDNVLTGNSAANTLTGGAGNDTYVVGSGDTVVEAAGGGTDTVAASISWTSLAANVENLTLTGSSAINGTGNTLNNVLTGNSAGNTLSGGTGADTLIGGAGNDTYVVDNASDVVTELANEGTDLVQSSVNYTLAANVENLTLTGTSGLSGTGNGLDNVLTGNSGANTLTGGAGNDRLDGGTGNDTMVGGTGNDTYVVNVSTDVVTEAAGEGIDTIESSATFSLASLANVENLTLTGSSAINATGNALDNMLTGNSGANVLTGGGGNDTYVVGTGDTTTEAVGAGTDTVMSAVTWTLATNLENLTLTGATAVNGTGNTADNVLIGNGAANTLQGLAGNDTYDGGAGNDTLTDNSTASNDTYRWGVGYGVDTVSDAGGSADRLEFGAGISAGQLVFGHVGNNLEITISGNASDKLVIGNYYVGTANKIETFALSDGSTVPGGVVPLSLVNRAFAAVSGEPERQAQALLSAMATFGAESAGSPPGERQTIQPVPRPEPMWVSPALM